MRRTYAQKKGSAKLIFRTAKLDFLFITPNDPELILLTMKSVKGWCNLLQDQLEMSPLQLNIGNATVTSTDSVKRLIDRAKKCSGKLIC
ncbi:MAG: hypothetical protein ACJAY7_001325 [Pseudohongiellaceae bacterium]